MDPTKGNLAQERLTIRG